MTSQANDITWGLGPGCHRLRLSTEVREVCRKWIWEAEVMEDKCQDNPSYVKDFTKLHQGNGN